MSELKKPIVWPVVDDSGEPKGFQKESWPTLYQDLQEGRQRQWAELAAAYEKDQSDFYAAWQWLHHHPVFWYFGRKPHESALVWEMGVDQGLEFRPVKINPDTLRIDEYESRNTKLQIWVEVFPAALRVDGEHDRLHDYVCDTGGDTYELAICEVAVEIYNRHGNDREVLKKEWSGA